MSNSLEPSPLLVGAKRHPTYYFDDGNVIFLVEETLFKIHRYFFIRDSLVFRSMFSLPQAETTAEHPLEGTTDENPIVLKGPTALDFERFLWVMYPPIFGVYETSSESWSSILHLATLYEFDTIRQLAISHLEHMSMSPIDRIVLAHKYDIEDWLLGPYIEIALRSAPLTVPEGRKVGVETAVLLAQAREAVKSMGAMRAAYPHHYVSVAAAVSTATPSRTNPAVWKLVRDIFDLKSPCDPKFDD